MRNKFFMDFTDFARLSLDIGGSTAVCKCSIYTACGFPGLRPTEHHFGGWGWPVLPVSAGIMCCLCVHGGSEGETQQVEEEAEEEEEGGKCQGKEEFQGK